MTIKIELVIVREPLFFSSLASSHLENLGTRSEFLIKRLVLHDFFLK
jgi:hypothetical protein